jgi:DNA-binding NarL/FixJ family response regulator
MIRLLLFTNEPVLARGVEAVLSSVSEFELVAVCSDAWRLAETVEACKPDLLLIDVTPQLTFGMVVDLQARFPESRIVLWIHSISAELAFQAMERGVRGILRKTLPPETFIKCLRIVSEGGLWFDEVLGTSLRGMRTVALSRRESQLVSLLSQGLKNKEIATALFITEGTVKVYLYRLCQKLGAKDRFELALFGLKNMAGEGSLIEVPQPRMTQPEKKNAGRAPLLHSLVLEKLSATGTRSV